MPADGRLNPASGATEQQIAQLEKKIDDLKAEYILFFNGDTRTPPEKAREDLERQVRRLVAGGAKTPRMDLIIQNLAQRFSLYNNMWLKKISELECDTPRSRKAKAAAAPPAKPAPSSTDVFLTLNDEETFERLACACRLLLPAGSGNPSEGEKLAESIKAKMLTHNLVEAKVSLQVVKGKLSIRIRK